MPRLGHRDAHIPEIACPGLDRGCVLVFRNRTCSLMPQCVCGMRPPRPFARSTVLMYFASTISVPIGGCRRADLPFADSPLAVTLRGLSSPEAMTGPLPSTHAPTV